MKTVVKEEGTKGTFFISWKVAICSKKKTICNSLLIVIVDTNSNIILMTHISKIVMRTFLFFRMYCTKPV